MPISDDLVEAILTAAPKATNLAHLGRLVDRQTHRSRTDGTWRGIWKNNPELAQRARDAMEKPTAARVVSSVGIQAADAWPDEDEVFARACKLFDQRSVIEAARQQQRIEFAGNGPVCIVQMADQHCGSAGSDYRRMEYEAQVVRDTPGMWAGTVGDLVDNFVFAWCTKIRQHTRLSITDEIVLARRYLGILAPKLLYAVGGNHDKWTMYLSGIDYFREVIAAANPSTIYDTDDSTIVIAVGGHEWTLRIRHKWAGYSIYNPTHGIERAAKFDKGRYFDVGIGAHTHVSGLARPFNNGGKTGLAVQCGTYKLYDNYAVEGGFPEANKSTAIALMFDPRYGTVRAYENIDEAAEHLERYYAREDEPVMEVG